MSTFLVEWLRGSSIKILFLETKHSVGLSKSLEFERETEYGEILQHSIFGWNTLRSYVPGRGI